MARNHATIYTSIWGPESEFRALDLDVQWCYTMLLSQPELSLVGVLKYDWKNWAANAADTTVESVQRMVGELEERVYVITDEDTDELWIRSFIHQDRVLAQPQVAMSAASAFGAVRSPMLRDLIRLSLPPEVREVWPEAFGSGKKEAVKALLDGCDAANWVPDGSLKEALRKASGRLGGSLALDRGGGGGGGGVGSLSPSSSNTRFSSTTTNARGTQAVNG